MASTPNFFLFSGLLFLARFTADVHSVKVLPDVLKGSTVVLRPVESVTSITAISWKHGGNLAVEWFQGNPTFYNIFKGTCSLNTETGELTINNVRPEHSGVYTPDINLKTRSAMKLRVFSPVPKPSISHDCVPGETLTCTLRCTLTFTLTCTDTCKFDTTGDLGHVEVFWILDDRHEIKGTELPITKDSKEETFICSVKNPVSSENSTKLLNPLLPRVPVWKPVVLTTVSLASVALLAFVCWKWIYPKYRLYWIIKEIQETKMFEEHDRILREIHTPGRVPEEDRALVEADEVILRILREGNKRNLSEDSIVMLLTARYVILRTLQQRHEVQESLENVQKIRKKFFREMHELRLYKEEDPTLQNADLMIWWILNKRNELKLSEGDFYKLLEVQRTLTISKMVHEEKERRALNGVSNDTSRPRDPAAERLISFSRPEAEDPV